MSCLNYCRRLIVVTSGIAALWGCAGGTDETKEGEPLSQVSPEVEGLHYGISELPVRLLAAAALELSARQAKDLMSQQPFAEVAAEPVETELLDLASALREEESETALEQVLSIKTLPEQVASVHGMIEALGTYRFRTSLDIERGADLQGNEVLVGFHEVIDVLGELEGEPLEVSDAEIEVLRAPTMIPILPSEDGTLDFDVHNLPIPFGLFLDFAIAKALEAGGVEIDEDAGFRGTASSVLVDMLDCELATEGLEIEARSACLGSKMAIAFVLERSVRALDSPLRITGNGTMVPTAGDKLELEGRWDIAGIGEVAFDTTRSQGE